MTQPGGTGVQAPGLNPRAYLKLVGIGAAIGIPAALVAALFLGLVHYTEEWLWTDLPDALGYDEPPWFLVVALPMVGATLVFVARRFLPGDGGHDPLAGLGTASVPWRHGPGVALAAFGTLAFGAVLGPEAPLIALGSVTGMVAVSIWRVEGRGADVLATAGSFSAVSALFGGPLVAGVLLLEAGVGLGAAVVPALLPGLVAAAVGYVLFVGLGSWGGIDVASLQVPDLPAYNGTRIVDLLLAIVVGIVVAVGISVIRLIAKRIAAASAARGKRPAVMLVFLLGGGAAVGVLALIARGLGDNSQDVLFSGQSSVPAELAETSVKLLLVLVVAKGLGYAISLGSGFRGGPVFPAIFFGIGVAMLAVVVFDSSPTWAVMVGTAAGMTAGVRLLFSSLVLATLLGGSAGFDALPAAVLAAVAAWLVATTLERRQVKPAASAA